MDTDYIGGLITLDSALRAAFKMWLCGTREQKGMSKVIFLEDMYEIQVLC